MALNRSNPFYNSVNQTRASMQSLQAMQKKYVRDYLPYFETLAGMYKVGPNKKAADDAVRLVERVDTLLEGMIQGGVITAKDTTDLYGYVDDIEESRQYFIQQAQKTQALQARMEKVTAETGVDIQDLGVSPGTARKAVRRDVQQSRGQTFSALRGQLPHTRQLGSQLLGGLGAAVAGPFQPLLKAGLGIGKDVLGLTGSLAKMARDRRQAQFGAQLRPVARGTSGEDLEALAASRGQGDRLAGFRGVSQQRPSIEEQTRPLQNFFEKGAYRAKWTKELLGSMKEASKGQKSARVGFGGLTEKFGSLGLAIASFIGKAGFYGVLGIAVALSAKQFGKLDIAIGEYIASQNTRKKSADLLAKVTEDKLKTVKEMGLDEYAKAAHKSPGQVLIDIASQEQRAGREQWSSRPWWKKTTDYWTGQKPPEVQPFYERTAEIQRLSQSKPVATPSASQVGPVIPGINDLDATIKKLTEQMQRNQYDSLPSAGIGDPNDSGDSLTRSLADGNLTTGR